MKKYLTIFSLSFQNEFTYRLNFILWRFRNVLRIIMTFYLWLSIFSSNKIVFGYSKIQIITYLFFGLFINGLVQSAPSNDNIGGEVSDGTLNNFLVKPLGYLRYWFTRDLSSKLLNILFAAIEISLLFIVFRPTLFVVPSLITLALTLSAIMIYFLLGKLAILIVFWSPENTWGLKSYSAYGG